MKLKMALSIRKRSGRFKSVCDRLWTLGGGVLSRAIIAGVTLFRRYISSPSQPERKKKQERRRKEKTKRPEPEKKKRRISENNYWRSSVCIVVRYGNYVTRNHRRIWTTDWVDRRGNARVCLLLFYFVFSRFTWIEISMYTPVCRDTRRAKLFPSCGDCCVNTVCTCIGLYRTTPYRCTSSIVITSITTP